MPSKKLKMAVLYGGKSAEHDVSIESAKNVMAAMDKKKYKILPIEIDRQGKRHAILAEEMKNADVIFPVLHGSYGEDGAMQGLCELLGKPFVGCGVLGSAIGMDKEATKRLLRDAGVPVAKFITSYKHSMTIDWGKIKRELGTPGFFKPANSGSSVGISKV